MTNPSTRTNPLDYPAYVRGLRPALPESLGQYVDDELEKIQNSTDNLAVAADENTKAKVSVEKIEREDADETLASLITTVQAEFEGELFDTNAAIVTEATARASADTAIASTVTTLSATVGTVSASVVTEASARAAGDGALGAKYGVTVSAGKVVGFELNAGGSTSDFIVHADHFAVDSGGERPFEIISGQVFIKNATIQTDAVDTPKIVDNAVSSKTASILGSAINGSGSDVDAISYTLVLPYDAEVVIQANGSQNYFTTNPAFACSIYVDGVFTGAAASGGAATYTASWALATLENLSAGSHSIVLKWFGGSSDIHLTAASLIIDSSFK